MSGGETRDDITNETQNILGFRKHIFNVVMKIDLIFHQNIKVFNRLRKQHKVFICFIIKISAL
jgi:hypothetical protein